LLTRGSRARESPPSVVDVDYNAEHRSVSRLYPLFASRPMARIFGNKPFIWPVIGIVVPVFHQHRCLPQYLSQRAAQPPSTIAQLMSPERGETHHAPVLSPPARPVEAHRIVGPDTRTWPFGPTPVRLPSKDTSASRDAFGSLSGHGCPGEHEPSSSLAAIPEILSRGPSAHQTGPSPSHT
jgi:hypothetical protein